MEDFSTPSASKSTPKDVFLHLLAIVLLYIGLFSFIALLWQYVDALLPDQLDYYRYANASAAMKNSIASLVVVWPVFIFVNWLLKKQEKQEAGKREIKVKKWLLYLTLFIASLAMIIDLIVLINNFLDGSLTLNFFLKVLAVLVVAGAVFWYYLWDLKQVAVNKQNLPKLFAWITSGVILFAIIAGFFVMGTPKEQRAKRFDEQRLQNLQMLQSEIINYWQAKGTLPADIADLKNDVTGFIPPQDPRTTAAYEYQAKGDLVFELCTVFETTGEDIKTGVKPQYIGPDYYGFAANWQHGAGRVCFERTIDPDYLQDKNFVEPIPVPR